MTVYCKLKVLCATWISHCLNEFIIGENKQKEEQSESDSHTGWRVTNINLSEKCIRQLVGDARRNQQAEEGKCLNITFFEEK